MEKENYKAFTSFGPEVEISLAFEGNEFVHYGYYNSIDDAIEALMEIKKETSK